MGERGVQKSWGVSNGSPRAAWKKQLSERPVPRPEDRSS
jgi:hypothetical protein